MDKLRNFATSYDQFTDLIDDFNKEFGLSLRYSLDNLYNRIFVYYNNKSIMHYVLDSYIVYYRGESYNLALRSDFGNFVNNFKFVAELNEYGTDEQND